MNFDFDLGSSLIQALGGRRPVSQFGNGSGGSARALSGAVRMNLARKKQAEVPAGFFAPFLTNHDQQRIMYQLGNSFEKMKLAATLLLTLPGTPFIYYGEEIGMTQTRKGDDIFKRAPMQWTSEDSAGFNTTKVYWVDDARWVPWRQNHKPWWQEYWNSQDRQALSVEGQQQDPASLLHFYKKLIALRGNHPEFTSEGTLRFYLPPDEKNILVFCRSDQQGNASFVFLNGSLSETSTLPFRDLAGKKVQNLLSGQKQTLKQGNVVLDPGEVLILKEVNTAP